MESWQQPKDEHEGGEGKRSSEAEQQPVLIDKGYGDSDVYVLRNQNSSHEGEEKIRKVYNPERIYSRLQQALEESFLTSLPTYPLLRKSAEHVKDFSEEDFMESGVLAEAIKRYQRDTESVSRFVDKNKDVFDFVPEDSKEIKKISFKVLPQGKLVDHSTITEAGLIVEGQEFVGGNNLDYVVQSDSLAKARSFSFSGHTDDFLRNIPEEFLSLDSINDILIEFQFKMMKRIAEILYGDPSMTDEDRKDYAPVIFHRIHPINVIPKLIKPGEWEFIITDLSTHISLDYLMLIARKISKA